jgi:hypothetical protein
MHAKLALAALAVGSPAFAQPAATADGIPVKDPLVISKCGSCHKPDERGMLVSPDGRSLYQFRNQVVVNTSDFKVVDRIDLAKPEFPGMTNVGLGGVLETIQEPGFYTSLFYSEDPVVRRRTFGIARFDLNQRDFTYTPIGPIMPGMGGLEVCRIARWASPP